MGQDALASRLIKMIHFKQTRKLLAGRIDDYIRRAIVEKADTDLDEVKLKRYQFLSAMLRCTLRNIDKGYVSKAVIAKIVEVFVENNFIRSDPAYEHSIEEFRKKYGEYPPTFIVLSPTQRCNLNCIGCYASSTVGAAATIPYPIVDRIIRETHDIFGCRFITISGGEPFMYRSEGKTLLDIFEKYNDMFFLVYTNGTLLNQEVADRLAKTANVTPAISLEGFEEETDHRRGKGTFNKITKAFENLRNAGVPFGISVTATSKNIPILLSDEFYDHYFLNEGACYMWQFQFMPIGRGKDEMMLMVNPENRVLLYEKWKKLLVDKKYCLADFWNSGVLSRGCIAYGRPGGYFYIDWNGNITPCAFIPYYVDKVQNLYENGKTLADGLFSEFMKNGRKWQREYGLDNWKKPNNWLMPCSIRDHYEIFRKSVLTGEIKAEDSKAEEALKSKEYFEILKKYDQELAILTEKIWENEYLKV